MKKNFKSIDNSVSSIKWGRKFAQNKIKLLPTKQEVYLENSAVWFVRRYDSAKKLFRENRLVILIHWGLYAIPSDEIK